MMSHKVEVKKVDLMDGEEQMQLVDKVIAALAQQNGKLKKSLSLRGIYKDHIVVRDTESSRMYRMKMSRDDSGGVQFEGMEEVKAVFVPVKAEKQDHTCVCPKCGFTKAAGVGEECRAMTCEKCGTKMTKQVAKADIGKTLVAVNGDVMEIDADPEAVIEVVKALVDDPSETVTYEYGISWGGVV